MHSMFCCSRWVGDPLNAGMLKGAQTMRESLKQECGTDLTIPQRMNPFWYTGPNDSATGDYRLKRPHKWLWAVYEGSSGGKGPPVNDGSQLGGARARAPHERPRKAMSCATYVHNFIENHMFKIEP